MTAVRVVDPVIEDDISAAAERRAAGVISADRELDEIGEAAKTRSRTDDFHVDVDADFSRERKHLRQVERVVRRAGRTRGQMKLQRVCRAHELGAGDGRVAGVARAGREDAVPGAQHRRAIVEVVAGIVYFIVMSIKQQTGIKVVGEYFQNSAH